MQGSGIHALRLFSGPEIDLTSLSPVGWEGGVNCLLRCIGQGLPRFTGQGLPRFTGQGLPRFTGHDLQ